MSALLLSARQISRRYGARTVLDSVDLRVASDVRIGLVGPNGSGKSTLLRILARLESPDAGTVHRQGTVGYLPRVIGTESLAVPVRKLIRDRAGVAHAARELERHATRLDDGHLGAIEPHAAALDRWLTLRGADFDTRLAAATAELGPGGDLLDRPPQALSGGQLARAGLAGLAVTRLDVVLLDEIVELDPHTASCSTPNARRGAGPPPVPTAPARAFMTTTSTYGSGSRCEPTRWRAERARWVAGPGASRFPSSPGSTPPSGCGSGPTSVAGRGSSRSRAASPVGERGRWVRSTCRSPTASGSW